jgi:hypothetical protein
MGACYSIVKNSKRKKNQTELFGEIDNLIENLKNYQLAIMLKNQNNELRHENNKIQFYYLNRITRIGEIDDSNRRLNTIYEIDEE